ncbi:MAG: PAS domain-containing sensor histidine kinase [Candidatus Auribacter fodinae]|jgi:PAS domain S-box-containing protein|uniref:histidine kinase n=1 Tax=Candidatus Auribacter fodinae TaxID=2093366 RepID=A0A3A4QVM6_9BACT|nr:MAG: PAS domain-containing sensor histidine kinase [Candidatus Auribacter fodinae]
MKLLKGKEYQNFAMMSFLESISTSMHDIMVVDNDYIIVAANDSFLQRVGLPRDEIIGQKCYTICHNVDRPCDELNGVEHVCPFRAVIETGETVHTVHCHKSADGKPIWLDIASSPLEYRDGKVTKMVQMMIDITELAESFDSLFQSEKNYRSVVKEGKNIYATIRIGDPADSSTWELSSLNRPWCGLDLLDASYSIRELRAVQPEWSWKAFEEACLQVYLTDKNKDHVEMAVHAHDAHQAEEKWSVELFPYHEFGKSVGVQLVAQNITQDNHQHEQCEQRISNMRELLYTVTHDLKSPLVSIRGYIALVKRHLNAQQFDNAFEVAERIISVCNRMEKTILDMLELQKTGYLALKRELVSFKEIVVAAVSQLEGAIHTAGAVVSIDESFPDVYADKEKLMVVMMNLIANAVDHGGRDNLLIHVGSIIQKNGETAYYVRDNGCGIDPKYHDRLFSLFFKLDPGGTGLGLAIVQKIITIHSGKVWLESSPGNGCTFYFTLGPKSDIVPGRMFYI